VRIGLTGAAGMLGTHVRALLLARGGHDVRLATRETFAEPSRLAAFADGLDVVLHVAGMNRGPEEEVEATNVRLAQELVAACRAAGARPALAFANSTHVDRDTAYGRGKREAARLLGAFAAEISRPCADLVLPHVFGEFGRPFYNSVVSTFCHQLAAGEEPRIDVDGELELLHAQTAAAALVDFALSGQDGRRRIGGARLRVSALLSLLKELHGDYANQIVPDLGGPGGGPVSELRLRLFNTLRSYLYPSRYPVRLELHSDPRGSLFEGLKARGQGQVFLSTTVPGVTRGNHFHLRKCERFLVVRGEAEIRLRRLFADEVRTFRVGGEGPCYVDMPTLYTHSITNVGTGELLTLFWTSEMFDPKDPDTFAEPVVR
jgi:UDP-2-acetamido-2,6-beta-L-arabino-hexul-4-ose reductase